VIPPESRRRWWLPLAAALWGAAICLAYQLAVPADRPSIIEFWTASHAVVHGQSPYAAVRALNVTPYPYYYPYPTALLMAPLAVVPWRVAWVLWSALGTGLLCLAGLRIGRGFMPVLFSGALLDALTQGAITPVLLAAAVLPAIAPLLILKPTIGAVLWTWRPSRWAVVGGLAVVALSLLLYPAWPGEWREAVRGAPHRSPVLRPGGFLLLLAWLRWRTSEGRLLGLLALMPQTVGAYEVLPLFLLARTRREGWLFAVLTFAAMEIKALIGSGTTLETRAVAEWPAYLLAVWLPALLLVLIRPTAKPEEPTAAASTAPSASPV
jgi:hypothetical protein